MTYNTTNLSLMSEDLSYIFVYANEITNGLFGFLLVLGFFFLIFLGSLFIQFRTTARIRPETSFLASSFVSFGLSVILSGKAGLVSPIIPITLLVMSLIGLIWVMISND